MAEISWIKLKTTMFDDEKIRLIQSLPEADAILVIWIRLLVLAGKTNDDGLIYIQRNMPYTEEMLATLFDKPVSVVRLALVTLQQFEMVDLGEDGLIAISNWEKHQNIEGMDKIREQNRLRKAKQREKQKLLTDVTGQSRDSHATDIDKELDKDKEKDINTMSSSDEQDGVQAKSSLNERFNFIWEQYPKGRKQGREKAFNSYKKAVKDGITDQIILNGLNAYKKQIKLQKTELQYIKQGSTWFNGKCWNDEYITTNDISNDKPDYVHVPKEFRT